MEKKIACCVCTWHRPHLLGRLIECFLQQDYPASRRELIILDDAGQYLELGDLKQHGWQIFSLPRRFRSLGEKRNASIALASADAEYIAIWDDDDLYLPHALSASAAALDEAEWSHPSLVLTEHADRFTVGDTNGCYQGGWAFRRSALDKVGGYRPINNGEDQDLAWRLRQAKTSEADPAQLGYAPFYAYSNTTATGYHLSMDGDDAWEKLGKIKARVPITQLKVGWRKDYRALPIERIPHVRGRTLLPPAPPGGRTIRICGGDLREASSNGPINGMYGLQHALRGQRDWLVIGGEPQPGELAWWWHFDDRGKAARWDRLGHPAIHGPNMFFLNSQHPRGDELERRLLDAVNVRAIFCHAEPYRQLIEQHRGPQNQAEWIVSPYPVHPRPPRPMVEPLYDVLLYLKSGYSRKVVHQLQQAFPEHCTIKYGEYDRETLGVQAAASRGAIYFSGDDHGPVALAEILLAGCPCVGLATTAPFITEVMGHHVPALDYENCRAGLRHVHGYQRWLVADHAESRFSPDAVLATLLPTLDRLRQT